MGAPASRMVCRSNNHYPRCREHFLTHSAHRYTHLFGGLGLRDTMCWILRTGAPWRDLPPDYGDWKNTHRRFCRWRDRGVWAMLLEAVMDDPDFEWPMIDASYIKAHPHSAGALGGNQSIARTKVG